MTFLSRKRTLQSAHLRLSAPSRAKAGNESSIRQGGKALYAQVNADVALWEIHEAFSAQVLFHVKALEDQAFLRERAGIANPAFGAFPRERINPNGGSVALGHPFGATGARILSQAVKELAATAPGSYAIVSICTDGGQGGVVLLQAG